ncbi:hypothetical protein ACWD0J_01925 [Streptomyces sp. NPDC003011]
MSFGAVGTADSGDDDAGGICVDWLAGPVLRVASGGAAHGQGRGLHAGESPGDLDLMAGSLYVVRLRDR